MKQHRFDKDFQNIMEAVNEVVYSPITEAYNKPVGKNVKALNKKHIKMLRNMVQNEWKANYPDKDGIIDVLSIFDQSVNDVTKRGYLEDLFYTVFDIGRDYNLPALDNDSLFYKYEDELLDAETLDNKIFMKKIKFPKLKMKIEGEVREFKPEYDNTLDWVIYTWRSDGTGHIYNITFTDVIEVITNKTKSQVMWDVQGDLGEATSGSGVYYSSLNDIPKIKINNKYFK
jgi:hypothetical protein